jgi:hypothetical protein
MSMGSNLPRTLAGSVWQIRNVCAVECLNIFFESSALDALSRASEKTIHDMVIVHLEQSPCRHLLCAQKVIKVGAVVLSACIAFASLDQGRDIHGIFR